LKPLTEEQRELIELLYAELLGKSPKGDALTPKQMDFLRKFILYFSK
jgi:uncharacterized protein YeaC (DUF1315 family)